MNFAKESRFVLGGLLSLLAGRAAAQERSQVDSIAVQRFIATRPNHIPLTKRRVLSTSESVSSTLQALSGFGFASMTSDSTGIPSLCRVRWADSSGMWITEFSGSNSRRVIIPDECPADTPEDAARVEALRAFAWHILRGKQ